MKRQKADRLMDGLMIRQSGGYRQVSGSRFIVKSQSKPRLTYSVGIKHNEAYCACKDYEIHGTPCKHILASVGYAALAACLQFRWSNEIEELEIAGELHAAALRTLPASLHSLARNEYAAARNRLQGLSRIAA